MSDSDPRVAAAFRKTDSSRHLFVTNYYGTALANLSDQCQINNDDALSDLWEEETIVDDFGDGVTHTRNGKHFMVKETYLEEIYRFTLGKRLRSPTDIIIVSDGYCCSGCQILCYNAKRTGSAILSGFGGTYHGDQLFVSGQAIASTIDPAEFFDEVANNSLYGLEFAATFGEMYNISMNMDEIIPSDFDVPRIDMHTGYEEGAFPVLTDLLNATAKVHEYFKTKCNPDNKYLIFVTDDCHVDDPNALVVGHPCGDDGVWNKSACRILTCQPMYTLDYLTNRCVPTVCDGRRVLLSSSSSSSSSLSSSRDLQPSASVSHRPAFGFIVSLFFFIFIFVH